MVNKELTEEWLKYFEEEKESLYKVDNPDWVDLLSIEAIKSTIETLEKELDGINDYT